MSIYTVIGYYEKTGRIFTDHIEADGAYRAMYLSAKNRPDATYICSHKGALHEGKGFEYAGEGVVDSETILEQADVFDRADDSVDVDESPGPVVPDGFALVPLVPTSPMLDELRFDDRMTDLALRVRYDAMLQASSQNLSKE